MHKLVSNEPMDAKMKNIKYQEKILELIHNKNGKCISATISNCRDKIHIICINGHEFWSSPNKIQQNRWCPICRLIPFSNIENFVKNKGGCVSGIFKGMKSKLDFKCSFGHAWTTTAASVVLSGTWCPYCVGRGKIDISEFQKIAIQRGGNCLSVDYNTQQDKLLFTCANNHQWMAYAKHIKAGHWCQRCNIYKGEEISRLYLEYIFNTKFPKFRADWLLNSQGNKLEFDGYAFEHQGEQHYGKNIFRISNFDDGYKIAIANDIEKESICKNRKICLIKIPSVGILTKIEDLPRVIEMELLKQNIVKKLENIPPNIINFLSKNSLEEMISIACDRGGKCISNVFVNTKTHLLFECKYGHQWKAIPSNIKRGTWCPKCKNKLK